MEVWFVGDFEGDGLFLFLIVGVVLVDEVEVLCIYRLFRWGMCGIMVVDSDDGVVLVLVVFDSEWFFRGCFKSLCVLGEEKVLGLYF